MADDDPMAVWAGLVAVDPDWNAFRDLADQARNAGGTLDDAGELAGLARFPDGDAATMWLLEAFTTWPNALAGALLGCAEVDAAATAATRIGKLLADARSGEVVLAPGLPAPPRLADPSGAPEASETPRRMRPSTGSDLSSNAFGGRPDDDVPTQVSDPRAARHSADAGPRSGTADGEPAGQSGGDSAPSETAGQGQTLQPGNVLSHTYRIEQRVGRGGMGTVYLARHVEFGSRHAVKVISPEHGEDHNVMALFRKEAENLRRVRHDAVITYDGTIRDGAGRLYLIMEYAKGPSLSEVLRDGPLSEAAAEILAKRIGSGLDAAHDKDLVHRDVSPDNIVLVGDDVAEAKIIDFGIARNLDASANTVIGSAFAGKYTYASPEQLGLYGGQVDPRSDIYSLGLTRAAALGKPLDMGQTPADAARRREHVPDLSAFPEPWAERLAWMLQPNPDDRPSRFSAIPGLATDTGPPTSDSPTPAVAAGAREASALAAPRENRGRRRGRAIAAATAIGLALALGVGAWLYRDALPMGLGQPNATGTAATASSDSNAHSDGRGDAASAESEGQAVSEDATKGDGETADASMAADAAADSDAANDPPSADAVRSALADALNVPDCGHVETALVKADGGYAVTLSGFVGDPASVDELRRAAAATANVAKTEADLAVHPPPFCTALNALAPIDGPNAPTVRLNQTDARYQQGERLTVEVATEAESARHVYVSYLDSEGIVQHLYPRETAGQGVVAAGERLRLGSGEGSLTYRAARPHGDNLLLAISSKRPLFDTRRRGVETLEAYLADLRPAIRAARGADGGVSVRTRFIRTEP